MPEQTHSNQTQPSPAGKKPYVAPTLTECGSVAKLTMGKGSTASEGGAPNKKSCL